MKKPIFSVFILFLILNSILYSQQRINVEQILKEKSWHEVYENYILQPDLIDLLKSKLTIDLKVDVYLAIWCSDSENNVPKFIRIIEALPQDKIVVNYYTVERKQNPEVPYYVESLKVERIPTFIFYRQDKEIGRIVENPQKDMLEDFLSIL